MAGAGGALEAHPRGVGHEAAAHGSDAEVHDDERESGREQHLGARDGVLEFPGAHPEEPLELDAGCLAACGSRWFPRSTRAAASPEDVAAASADDADREASAGAAAGELDEAAARQAALRGGDRAPATLVGIGSRGAAGDGRSLARESRPPGPASRPRPRLSRSSSSAIACRRDTGDAS